MSHLDLERGRAAGRAWRDDEATDAELARIAALETERTCALDVARIVLGDANATSDAFWRHHIGQPNPSPTFVRGFVEIASLHGTANG